ncbi:hypothetical protein PL8927_780216 [Planktothrix serta PCC 8927]|uniref:Uncharacterized protein n=1 Tax=Planktothrix serta PCC 8927 TaxID=671068 RepID=A0A7Z9E3U3_9CYAN|nr:hypothetical protein PL8927_780216 [Planktothrix serta PCC 8927]
MSRIKYSVHRLGYITCNLLLMMAQEEGISYQELINLYLQDCVTSGCKLSVKRKLDEN